MILTDAELKLLTRRTRASAQIRVLEAIRVPYRRRPDGSIVVFRRDVEGPVGLQREGPRPQLRLDAPRVRPLKS